MNKDQQLIWEAYANLQEAPVGMGDWDAPFEPEKHVKKGKNQGELLRNWSKGTMDPESLTIIKNEIGAFLDKQPEVMVDDTKRKIFKGSWEQFREAIRDIIVAVGKRKDTKLKISATNAWHSSRVIRNVLDFSNNVENLGDKVEIVDADSDDIGKAVAVGMKKSSATPGVESKSQIKYQARYHLNKEPSVEHHEQMQAGKNFLMQSDLGLSFTGKELLLALNKLTKRLNKSERLATRLLEAGVIEPMEEETEDDEERVVDVGDDDETGEQDYESSLRSAYADLQRDISSGASPTMRPSDW